MRRLGCKEMILSGEQALQAFRDAGYRGDRHPGFIKVFQMSQNAVNFFNELKRRGLLRPENNLA